MSKILERLARWVRILVVISWNGCQSCAEALWLVIEWNRFFLSFFFMRKRFDWKIENLYNFWKWISNFFCVLIVTSQLHSKSYFRINGGLFQFEFCNPQKVFGFDRCPLFDIIIESNRCWPLQNSLATYGLYFTYNKIVVHCWILW